MKERFYLIKEVVGNAIKCQNSKVNFAELTDVLTKDKFYLLTEKQLKLILKKEVRDD